MAQVTVSRSKSCVVVEIVTASLMDPLELDALGADLYRLVDEQDARRLLLDFGKVQYISSQAIGILAKLHKKTNALKGGLLVLCNLSPRLLELLKIMRFDKLMPIKASQEEALNHFERMKALT
jgi:anti-sigma B factor antagonist